MQIGKLIIYSRNSNGPKQLPGVNLSVHAVNPIPF